MIKTQDVAKEFITHWGRPWMLWYAVGLHTIWAIALLGNSDVERLVVLAGLNKISNVGIDPTSMAIILLLISISAAYGLHVETKLDPRIVFCLIVWQYLVLLIAVFSDLEILITGKNPANGEPVDRFIILALLGPVMWAGLLHSCAIIERFLLRWRR